MRAAVSGLRVVSIIFTLTCGVGARGGLEEYCGGVDAAMIAQGPAGGRLPDEAEAGVVPVVAHGLAIGDAKAAFVPARHLEPVFRAPR